MAAVTHPNLAFIFGAESWRGVPVLVMEYLAGGTLTQRLGEPAPVVDTLKLGVALAEALESMHAQGVLHRDVKPSNIGFTTAGVPKLLDFGLARILDESLGALPPAGSLRDPAKRVAAKRSELTGSDHIVGTPLYLPPEALSGHPASPSQDLWSLSMVLYEAIAGHHPLRTPTGLDLKAVGKPLPDVRQFRQDCPRPVAEMFQEVPEGIARINVNADTGQADSDGKVIEYFYRENVPAAQKRDAPGDGTRSSEEVKSQLF